MILPILHPYPTTMFWAFAVDLESDGEPLTIGGDY
jgi:hypothetical protein